VFAASWSPARKAAAGAFAAILCAGLVALAVYSSAVLFLLLNKVDPRGVSFAGIVTYWQLYKDEPKLRKKLLASIGASAVGWLIVVPAAAILGSRPRRRLHGDARFATPAEIAAAGLILRTSSPPSVLIGRHRGRFLALPGQLSVMLSAPTRSGKGVGVVIPNLLNWPHSVVVLDIKGENHAITAGYRAERGQAVYAFAPFDDEARSHRWNPLSSVRTSELHRVGDLLAIGQVFFPTDGNTSSEAFFNDQARNLFLGVGLFLLETPELPRTVGEMLRQSSGKGQSFKDHFRVAIDERARSGKPLSIECVDALQRLLSNSDNTLTSIVATFNAPLTVFADAVVDAATSGDDFNLADVRRKPMSIYVCIPPHRLASARPLLNLFFSQLVSLNTHLRPDEDPALRLQCLLVHDEFTSMGRVGVIASAASFLAGYNLRLLTIIQAMSQLDAVYGDKEARTFATNHGLQILFAPREQRDADEYSAMLGNFTERATSRGRSRSFGQHGHNTVSRNESEQRRPLLLPQEFKELGRDRLVAIVENCKPILAEKIRYHREPLFRARLRPPPPVPRLDMDLHFAKAQQRWRYADDDLESDQALDVERLAHDVSGIPQLDGLPSPDVVKNAIDQFLEMTRVAAADVPTGGAIEPLLAPTPAQEPSIERNVT
jgi:type IV secretion system protein VirD4